MNTTQNDTSPTIGVDSYKNVYISYTTGTVSGGSLTGTSDIVIMKIQVVTSSSMASCLLKGTMVQTDYGLVPIERIREGDYVLNQHGKPVKVRNIGSWTYTYADSETSEWQQVYKLPKGSFQCDSDTYLSKGHRIVCRNGGFVLPSNLSLERANPSEICEKDGTYTLYHLRLERQSGRNHIVVNGNCVVEDWK